MPRESKHGMKVTLVLTISIEQAITLKVMADRKNVNAQQVVKDLIDEATERFLPAEKS